MSVQKDQSVCTPFLDPSSETSLTLITQNAKIDNVAINTTLSWKFYFPLLASINAPLFPLDLTSPTNGEDALESPLNSPPNPGYDRSTDNIPWRDVGRFIWWKLTLDHIPTP